MREVLNTEGMTLFHRITVKTEWLPINSFHNRFSTGTIIKSNGKIYLKKLQP